MSSPDNAESLRRRKVRKGTRSCWECKRRKIKCVFASAEDSKCICCQRRRLPCVSQELPEELAPARNSDRHLTERIARVENFMKECLAKGDGTTYSPDLRRDPRLSSVRIPLTPAESLGESLSNTPFLPPDSQDVLGQPDWQTARRNLLASFPGVDDAKVLLHESQKPELYTLLVNTRPHNCLTLEALSAPCGVGQLPGPNIHPVLLAKQMLIFAITLQCPCGDDITNLSEPPDVLMPRLVTAVATWVTNKEEMQVTVDCLVCIILEGMFEVNRGQLRRAWSVFRRAMTVAQLMGLHRSPIPPQKCLDSKANYDPEFLWFRVVYMDRYLSILLGLPQGTAHNKVDLAPSSRLQHVTPLGRFDQQLSALASRILERNDRPFTIRDKENTEAIDAELLSISNSMPSSFWHAANFHSLTPGAPETLLETVRLSSHVYYFGLLIQLHLPYMMHTDNSDTTHTYAKTTCANAGREIMTRFIAHRSFNPKSSCSRPVDFFALLAAMTLLLAHLDTHNRGDQKHNILAHQRLSDRAMLEQALERMDVISSAHDDAFMSRSSTLIRKLLDVEGDAAGGNKFVVENVRSSDRPSAASSDDGLQLHIPYLGFVRIAPQKQVPDGEAANAQLQGDMGSLVQADTGASGLLLDGAPDLCLATDSANDWTFQGVDTAFFDSLLKGTSLGMDQWIDGATLEMDDM